METTKIFIDKTLNELEQILLSDEAIKQTALKFQPAIELVYHSAFEDAVPSKALKQIDEFARTWILQRSLTLAKLINTTTMDAIRKALAEGFAEGESIQQLAKRIEGYFDGNARVRATMTARTEVISAYSEGQLHRYELEGVEKSEFYAAPDACDECQPLDGEVYTTKDSHGVIPVHVNCRCRWFASE
jgi:SPP1 gp7 family putative phage head morphogenesis protein